MRAFILAMLITGALAFWFSGSTAETCSTDTECMQMHGGDGGPGD